MQQGGKIFEKRRILGLIAFVTKKPSNGQVKKRQGREISGFENCIG